MSNFHPKTKYEYILDILKTMSPTEYQYICPNGGEYKDSHFSLFKYIHFDKGNAVGFVDLYPFEFASKGIVIPGVNNKECAFIIVGINPEYRHKKILKTLITVAESTARELKFKEIIWKCDESNIASRKAAIKYGFKLKYNALKELIYIKRL